MNRVRFGGTLLQRHDLPGTPSDPSGSQAFIALLEAFRATGGTAPGEVVDRLLQELRAGRAASLTRLLDAGQVFGFEWRASLWIPMFQFRADDLALRTGAQRVRAELSPQWAGWAVACWFAAPNARLQGRRPADTLEADLDAVVQAARKVTPFDGPAPARARRTHQVAARV